MKTGAGPQGLNGLGKVRWDPVGEEAGWVGPVGCTLGPWV
jgi:hypothetical protein